jgi:hypothetical protein
MMLTGVLHSNSDDTDQEISLNQLLREVPVKLEIAPPQPQFNYPAWNLSQFLRSTFPRNPLRVRAYK